MKIKEFMLDRSTIENFADKNNLTMEVHERSHKDGPARYYAHFEHAEIKEGCMLRGHYGNGHTPEEAIANYAAAISLTVLVIDAMDKNKRREILVPILAQ